MAFVRNQNKKNVIIEKQDTNINRSSKKFQESKNTQFQPQFTKSEAIWMMGLIKNLPHALSPRPDCAAKSFYIGPR